MCDPITATVVGLSVASGGFTAYNQYKQGVAESKYNNYLATQSENEGKQALAIADKQSTAIQDTAKEQGKGFKRESAQFGSSQRAAMAAMGIQGVTAEDIANDTFNKQRLDELAIRYNADVKSWETNTQAANQNWAAQTQANQYRYAAKNAKHAGKIAAFTTLLGTATSTASMLGGGGPKAPGSSSQTAINNTGFKEGRM
jgi:hypothetical protein